MWRLAKSLAVLRSEANAVAPERSKVADGTIGDASHAVRPSRHNPNNAGVVCALDITHDPEHGMDTYLLFDWLRTHPHPNLEYCISNGRVTSRSRGWLVRAYSGTSKHDHHIHIGVGRGPDEEPYQPYDDETSWGLAKWKEYRDGQEEEEEMPIATVANKQVAAEAHKALAEAGILTQERPVDDAASVGLLEVALARLLKRVEALENEE